MKPASLVLLFALVLPLAACTEPVAGSRGQATSLLEREQDWPYRVALARPWAPGGSDREFPVGTTGVLIRVEDDGTARIDFGRDGLYRVPVDATDLAERSDAVRDGRLDKLAPNLVLSIGRGLIDPGSDTPRAYPYQDVVGHDLFLCVFADPRTPEFERLAHALGPFLARPGLLTLFFPQGRLPDPDVRERLRDVEWPAPFFYRHLAEPNTRALIGEHVELPVVALLTAEGRELFAERFRPDVVPALDATLARTAAFRRQHHDKTVETATNR